MTILRIINRRADWAMYNAINARVDIEHQHPLGLIMHGVAEVDGTVQVAQVWESEEYARRFDEERLKPALEAVGAPLDAEVTTFDCITWSRPDAACEPPSNEGTPSGSKRRLELVEISLRTRALGRLKLRPTRAISIAVEMLRRRERHQVHLGLLRHALLRG